MEYLKHPAFYAHLLSSACILIAIIILIKHYKYFLSSNKVTIANIFAVLAIAIAAHAQSHIALEKAYGYNPLYALTR